MKPFFAVVLTLGLIIGLLIASLHGVVCYDLYSLRHRMAEIVVIVEDYRALHRRFPDVKYIYDLIPQKELPTEIYYHLQETSYSVSGSDSFENWITFTPEEGWTSTRQCLGVLD